MRSLFFRLVAGLAVALVSASVAQADHCGLRSRLANLFERSANAVQKARNGLGQTRFFDGDGRPLRKAR